MNFLDRKLKLKWKRSFTGFSITNSLESNENEKSTRMVDENGIWLEIHFNSGQMTSSRLSLSCSSTGIGDRITNRVI